MNRFYVPTSLERQRYRRRIMSGWWRNSKREPRQQPEKPDTQPTTEQSKPKE